MPRLLSSKVSMMCSYIRFPTINLSMTLVGGQMSMNSAEYAMCFLQKAGYFQVFEKALVREVDQRQDSCGLCRQCDRSLDGPDELFVG